MNKRPTQWDNEVIEAASHEVAKHVYRWVHGTKDITNHHELEEIRLALLKVLDYSKDGYEMTKDMEDVFYGADSELVEIMDDASHTLYTCHRNLVEKWVKENNITPKLSIGTEVNIKPNKFTPTAEGEIVAICNILATYTVTFPSLGHIKNGPGVNGLVLPFEYVEDQITDEAYTNETKRDN